MPIPKHAHFNFHGGYVFYGEVTYTKFKKQSIVAARLLLRRKRRYAIVGKLKIGNRSYPKFVVRNRNMKPLIHNGKK